MNNKLDIVTEDRTMANRLYVDSSNITTKTGAVLNSGSYSKPLLLSELLSKLINRKYHIVSRKEIDANGKLLQQKEIMTSPDIDPIIYNGMVYRKDDSPISICDMAISESEMNSFINNYYKKIVEMKENESVVLYNSSKLVVDILSGSITLDLISGDEYTNTLSLINAEKRMCKPNLSGKVDLTVKYSKNNTIYSHNLTFEAFKYSSDDVSPTVERNHFMGSVGQLNNPDITIEYIDGVIRAIPCTNSIDECIIGNCLLTYGYV